LEVFVPISNGPLRNKLEKIMKRGTGLAKGMATKLLKESNLGIGVLNRPDEGTIAGERYRIKVFDRVGGRFPEGKEMCSMRIRWPGFWC
jgi:hypothetical protein